MIYFNFSAGMMGEGLLTLTYGKHHACILNEVGAAWRGARYSDLVLVCDDAVPLAAHRIVMAAASPLIRYVFDNFTFHKKKILKTVTFRLKSPCSVQPLIL